MRFLCTLFTLIYVAIQINSQDVITVDHLRLDATFQHISCNLTITGDDNGNSEMEIFYKHQSNSNYLPGAKCMRAKPAMIVDGSALNMNFHAGSAMFLEVDASYDIRVVISDPDGGSMTIDTTIKTRSYPKLPIGANTISVTTAGGLDAIQTAINIANSGDIIEVDDGVYSPFSVEKDNIFVVSKNRGGATIEGSNTDRGVITIGTFNDSSQFVFISGFVIQNGRWGIDAQNTQYLTVQNCEILDVDYGIVNRRANGWENNQYITNNKFEGRTPWPQSDGNIPGERAIDIRGNNNVVSYNTITNFGDGVTTDGPPYQNSFSCDIHHNDISRIVDDLIEVDGMVSNSRVYSNRAYNGRAGISLAPVYGGPAYVFRNEFVNMENSTFKMNRKPAGLYLAHNTTIQEGDGMSSDAGWQNTIMKNNIVYAAFYCFQEYGLIAGSMDDWDYNAYYSARAGTSGTPWFKWDNIRYAKISELQSGTSIETNGLELGISDLVTVSLPTDPFIEVLPASLDLSPIANASHINQGELLLNINIPYVADGMPDIGASEFGAQPERYGHDFNNLCNESSPNSLQWNGSISESWTDRQNWSPCGVPTAETTITIPDGLSRYPTIFLAAEIKELQIGN